MQSENGKVRKTLQDRRDRLAVMTTRVRLKFSSKVKINPNNLDDVEKVRQIVFGVCPDLARRTQTDYVNVVISIHNDNVDHASNGA